MSLGLITRTSDCPAIHLRISALDWRRERRDNEMPLLCGISRRTRLAARLRTAKLWPGASVLSRGLRPLKASRLVSLAGDQPPAARSETGHGFDQPKPVATKMAQAEIIQFPTSGRASSREPRAIPGSAPIVDRRGEVQSDIGRNEQLRSARRDGWRAAEAKLDYWRAWEKLHSAIRHGQRCDVLDDLRVSKALLRPHGDFSDYSEFSIELLHLIRAAEIELLLTPAPTVAALTYKKSKLLHPWYRRDADADDEYLRKHFRQPLSPFRDIEQAIADDEAWLKAHPARQCHSNGSRRRKPAN